MNEWSVDKQKRKFIGEFGKGLTNHNASADPQKQTIRGASAALIEIRLFQFRKVSEMCGFPPHSRIAGRQGSCMIHVLESK